MEKKRNLWVIPTDKPSRLKSNKNVFDYSPAMMFIQEKDWKNQNIYITSDEEIKVNDYITDGYKVWKWKDDSSLLGRKKIILTTDQDLIKDGVQAIDDSFLEWFVKNPSCEEVEVVKTAPIRPFGSLYKIIIPKEETERGITITHKQETLEEAAEKYSENWEETTGLDYENTVPSEVNKLDFINGAKWQAERMYSEEDIIDLIQFLSMNKEFNEYSSVSKETAKYFLEQFKKK